MKKHYRHIDVIKGICILIVIIEHAKWDRAFRLRYLFPFWDRIAIPCFMVISGFVYAKSLERKTIKEYYSFENITKKTQALPASLSLCLCPGESLLFDPLQSFCPGRSDESFPI